MLLFTPNVLELACFHRRRVIISCWIHTILAVFLTKFGKKNAKCFKYLH